MLETVSPFSFLFTGLFFLKQVAAHFCSDWVDVLFKK